MKRVQTLLKITHLGSGKSYSLLCANMLKDLLIILIYTMQQILTRSSLMLKEKHPSSQLGDTGRTARH